MDLLNLKPTFSGYRRMAGSYDLGLDVDGVCVLAEFVLFFALAEFVEETAFGKEAHATQYDEGNNWKNRHSQISIYFCHERFLHTSKTWQEQGWSNICS